VPRGKNGSLESVVYFAGDRQFESVFLHRRVRKEPPGSCERHPVLRGLAVRISLAPRLQASGHSPPAKLKVRELFGELFEDEEVRLPST
jgi:hypothetical protein